MTDKWKPIETAPKDGTIILVYRPSAPPWAQVAPAKWNEQKYSKHPNPFWELFLKIGGVYGSRSWGPTHWMPLPDPPTDNS